MTLLLLGLVGCGRVSDVSSDAGYWGGYKKNHRYTLKRDVFLVELDSKYTKYALVPEANHEGTYRRHYSRPKSVEDYRNGKIEIIEYIDYQTPIKVLGIVKAGTVVEPVAAMLFRDWSWFFGESEVVHIFGKVRDPSGSDIEVDMEDLSLRDFGGKSSCCRNHAPNRELLGEP